MSALLESEVQQSRCISLPMTDGARPDQLETIIRELIRELGLDLADQHFKGTPARVARLYREMTHGYRIDPADIMITTIAFGSIISLAGWLMIPYLMWVTYAAALNFAIWRLNS